MLNSNAGAMVTTMALCVFSGVVLLGGVNPFLAIPVVTLSILLGVLKVVSLAYADDRTFPEWRLSASIGLFVVYAGVRYYWSVPEYEAREELIAILVAALVGFVACGVFNDRKNRGFFVYGLMGLAVLESVYGAWQAFSHATTVLVWERPEVYDGRGSGTYICPNHFAGFLEIVMGLVVARAVFLRNEGKTIEKSTILKVVTIYGAVMIAGGLVVSLSRGGWLAGAAGMLALLLFGGSVPRSRVPKLAITGAVVVCAVGLLWSVDSVRNYLLKTVTVDIDKQQVTVGDATLGGRVYMWKGTLPLIQDRPLFGTGIGSWRWEFQKHHSPHIFSFPEYTHNDYLNLASDYGLVGVCLVVFVFVAFFIHATRVARMTKSSEERAFAIGAMSAVVAILVHSFFDFNLHILSNSTLLAAVMGSVAGIPVKPIPARSPFTRLTARLGVAVGIGAAVLTLVFLFVPTFRSYWEFEKGNVAKSELKYSEALVCYDAAVRIDPGFSKPLIRSGDILKDQAGWRLGPTKQLERKELAAKAVAFYEKALALNPLHADVWVRQAQAQAMAGEHISALSSFHRAIEIAPVNAYAHFALGRFYSDRGEEQKALESFRKANDYYFHNEPMFFMNAVEAEERIRSRLSK